MDEREFFQASDVRRFLMYKPEAKERLSHVWRLARRHFPANRGLFPRIVLEGDDRPVLLVVICIAMSAREGLDRLDRLYGDWESDAGWLLVDTMHVQGEGGNYAYDSGQERGRYPGDKA